MNWNRLTVEAISVTFWTVVKAISHTISRKLPGRPFRSTSSYNGAVIFLSLHPSSPLTSLAPSVVTVKAAFSWTAWRGSRTRSQCAPLMTRTRRPVRAWLWWRRRPAAGGPSSSSLGGDTSVRTRRGDHSQVYLFMVFLIQCKYQNCL